MRKKYKSTMLFGGIEMATRKINWGPIFLLAIFTAILLTINAYIAAINAPIISPCPDSGCVMITQPTPSPSPEAEAKVQPDVKPVQSTKIGVASYYSRTGCIGCSPDLTMANGEPLDDNKMTVAYNRAPLNTHIEITNLSNGRTVTAKVTDRGGFEAHGKIIDLSVATKAALGCGDVCKVEVSK